MKSQSWKIQVLVLFACSFLLASCQNAAVLEPQVGWEHLPQILAEIKAPVFPDRDFVITDFGAIADGKTKCTEAFKKAMLACNKSGGGRVVVPEGTFLTGPIHLKSNVNLHVSKGATLLFSTDYEDYLPQVLVRWEGVECMNLSPLIYAWKCENIGITGQGTINGQGPAWWKWRGNKKTGPYRASNNVVRKWAKEGKPVKDRIQGTSKDFHWCPTFITPMYSKNILIEGLTVIDSPFWNLNPVYCENVTIRGLTIDNHGPNGDGCNPDSCKNVLIENCYFNTGDDCIAIKSGRDTDGRRVNVPCENIIVRNCEMKNGHGGVVIGSEMSGGVRNVYAENCVMDSPNLDRALRIKTNPDRGGFVENVYMRNIKVGQVSDAVIKINFIYQNVKEGEFIPWLRNVNVENVTSEKSRYGISIDAHKKSPARDITIKNCTFKNVSKGNRFNSVENVTLENVAINDEILNKTLNPVP